MLVKYILDNFSLNIEGMVKLTLATSLARALGYEDIAKGVEGFMNFIQNLSTSNKVTKEFKATEK